MLTDIIPARYRKAVYAVLALAALVVAAWQAADGDWWTFAASLIVSLSHTVAASNTPTSYDDGLDTE